MKIRENEHYIAYQVVRCAVGKRDRVAYVVTDKASGMPLWSADDTDAVGDLMQTNPLSVAIAVQHASR